MHAVHRVLAVLSYLVRFLLVSMNHSTCKNLVAYPLALSLFKVKILYFFAGSFHRMQNVKYQMMAKITLNSEEKVSTYDHLTLSILQSVYCKINLPNENNSGSEFIIIIIIITCICLTYLLLFLISSKV